MPGKHRNGAVPRRRRRDCLTMETSPASINRRPRHVNTYRLIYRLARHHTRAPTRHDAAMPASAIMPGNGANTGPFLKNRDNKKGSRIAPETPCAE